MGLRGHSLDSKGMMMKLRGEREGKERVLI